MHRLLPLLGDVGLGILSTFCVEWVSGYEFEILHYIVGLIVAFLPDLDAFGDKEFLRRGVVAAHAGNLRDHREGLHKPIVWFVGAAILWIFSPIFGPIIFFGILVHFLHDSVGTGWGVQWLWPCTTWYKLFVTKQNHLTWKIFLMSWKQEELPGLIGRHGFSDWIEKLYLRPTIISVTEYLIFLLGASVFIWRFLM